MRVAATCWTVRRPAARRTSFPKCSASERASSAGAAAIWPQFGRLISASGESSIRNYECGCPPLVDLYEILISIDGVYGARFSGAGFRGCCLALVAAGAAEQAAAAVLRRYREPSRNWPNKPPPSSAGRTTGRGYWQARSHAGTMAESVPRLISSTRRAAGEHTRVGRIGPSVLNFQSSYGVNPFPIPRGATMPQAKDTVNSSESTRRDFLKRSAVLAAAAPLAGAARAWAAEQPAAASDPPAQDQARLDRLRRARFVAGRSVPEARRLRTPRRGRLF